MSKNKIGNLSLGRPEGSLFICYDTEEDATPFPVLLPLPFNTEC